jgi:hypothetical protein
MRPRTVASVPENDAFFWAGRVEDRACRQLRLDAARQQALGQDVQRGEQQVDRRGGAGVCQGVKIEVLGQPAIMRVAPSRAAAGARRRAW